MQFGKSSMAMGYNLKSAFNNTAQRILSGISLVVSKPKKQNKFANELDVARWFFLWAPPTFSLNC